MRTCVYKRTVFLLIFSPYVKVAAFATRRNTFQQKICCPNLSVQRFQFHDSTRNARYGKITQQDPRKCVHSGSSLKMTNLNLAMDLTDLDHIMRQLSIPLLVLVAAILGISSQSLISSMLEGDQGLRAFLSDGSGYGKSQFKPRKKGDNGNGSGAATKDDPLPWLKLPKFDFVDVAGQNPQGVSEEMISERLQELATRGKMELEAGNKEKAAETMKELNSLLEKSGFEFFEGS